MTVYPESISPQSALSPDLIALGLRIPFPWHHHRLRALNITPEAVPVEELRWQLELPLFETERGGPMDLVPLEVIDHPRRHPAHYERVMRADLRYPLDTMRLAPDAHTIIMDGFHRLLKAEKEGRQEVEIHRVPPEARPLIERIGSCALCKSMEAHAWRPDHLSPSIMFKSY